jgi:hypothetical protein
VTHRVRCRVTAIIGVVTALTLPLAGCNRDLDDHPATADSAVPVDPVLLAYLSRARSAHHRADLTEANDPKLATIALQQFVEGPVPPGGTSLAEVREVLADTHARLADLWSRQGEFDRAQRSVARGLELAPEISYFRGHLFEVQGFVEERVASARGKLARRLLEAGDDELKGPDRDQLESRTDRLDALRDQIKAGRAPSSAGEELASLQRGLDEFRLSRMPPERQAKHRALLRERDAAVGRALEAFERSMDIQAKVIAGRTQSAPGPSPSSH